jgi:hypothetical protein
MRQELDEFLGQRRLQTLGFAIALGWSLYQTAHGVAVFVDGLLTHLPPQIGGYVGQGGLTWVVRHHLVSVDQLLEGAIELLLVVVAWILVSRRGPKSLDATESLS